MKRPIAIDTNGVQAKQHDRQEPVDDDTIQISAATNCTVTWIICGSEMLTASVISRKSLEKRDDEARPDASGRNRASGMRLT